MEPAIAIQLLGSEWAVTAPDIAFIAVVAIVVITIMMLWE